MPFEIVKNDITRMRVDAIVNAANNTLLGGGGVDGAIHRAAGPGLLEECRRLNGCETGQAKLTRGYDLPCKYVIHTVGPVWQGGEAGEKELLAACYRNALALAEAHGCASVAFPLISAGIYGYPKGRALRVAVREIGAFLEHSDMRVYMAVLSKDAAQLSGALFQEVAAYMNEVYVDERFDADRAARRDQIARGEVAQPGGLFRRTHREDDARNETVFDQGRREQIPTIVNRVAPEQSGERFSELLNRRIAQKGISVQALCRRANVDPGLLARLQNNPDYRPEKRVALALAIALESTLDETRELLFSAGCQLSRSSRQDVVAEYCVMSGNYNLIDINLVLFKLDLQGLGD